MIRQTTRERKLTFRKEPESRDNHGTSNFRTAEREDNKKSSTDCVPKIVSRLSLLATVPPPPPSDQSSTYPPSPHSPVRNRWGRLSGHDLDDAKLPPAFRAALQGSKQSAPILPTRRYIDETQPEKYAPCHESLRPPSKLPRTYWPPVLPQRDIDIKLLSKSLSNLISQACVQSRLSSFEVEEDKVGARAKKQHPKSSLPRGKVVRKVSLRVHWGGDEIFFIKPRQPSISEDAYFMGDLLKDRFAAEKGGDDSFGSSMILGDRFESRRGDVCPPSCPARAQYSDMSNYADELDKLNWDEADPEQQQPVSDNKTQIGSSYPFIWITTLDEDEDESSSTAGLTWRVKRAWDDPALDELEAEHLVNDEGLLDMVKGLIGVGRKPSEDAPDRVFSSSEEEPHYHPTMSLWNVKKFYDINGEIDSSESEKAVDEHTMLCEIKDMSLESAWAARAGNDNDSEAATTQCQEKSEAVKDKGAKMELTSLVDGSTASPLPEKRSIAKGKCGNDHGERGGNSHGLGGEGTAKKSRSGKKNKTKNKTKSKTMVSIADLLSPPRATTFIDHE